MHIHSHFWAEWQWKINHSHSFLEIKIQVLSRFWRSFSRFSAQIILTFKQLNRNILREIWNGKIQLIPVQSSGSFHVFFSAKNKWNKWKIYTKSSSDLKKKKKTEVYDVTWHCLWKKIHISFILIFLFLCQMELRTNIVHNSNNLPCILV